MSFLQVGSSLLHSSTLTVSSTALLDPEYRPVDHAADVDDMDA